MHSDIDSITSDTQQLHTHVRGIVDTYRKPLSDLVKFILSNRLINPQTSKPLTQRDIAEAMGRDVKVVNRLIRS